MAYVQPTAADLKMRYPAFAAVEDAKVEYWLTDARLIVTNAWAEVDRANAEMALAAHNMALSGYGTAGGPVGDLAAMGVESFKSASMSVSFNAAAIGRAGGGGYSSTRYGVQFLPYLRRNVGGPRLVGCCA